MYLYLTRACSSFPEVQSAACGDDSLDCEPLTKHVFTPTKTTHLSIDLYLYLSFLHIYLYL